MAIEKCLPLKRRNKKTKELGVVASSIFENKGLTVAALL